MHLHKKRSRKTGRIIWYVEAKVSNRWKIIKRLGEGLTRAEAQRRLDEMKQSHADAEIGYVNHRVTLRDFAIKEWLPKRKAAKEEKTYELDESVTRLHLLPKFGDIVLRAIAL